MSRTAPKLYPCLSYRDPAAAIEFLTRAFGFQKMQETPGADGTVAHAELSFGPEVIMLGAAKPALGWASPRDLPAVNQMVYAYVEDVAAHYEHAKAAGAEITRELRDTEYGSREYSAKDNEGHEWHFGTYRPTP